MPNATSSEAAMMPPPSSPPKKDKLATSPLNGGGGGFGRLARSLSLRPKKERQAAATLNSPRSPTSPTLTSDSSISPDQTASPQQQVMARWGRPPAGATVEDAMREASGILTDEPVEGSFSAAGFTGGSSNHVRTPSNRRAQEDRDALLSPQSTFNTSTLANGERSRGHSRTGSASKLLSSSRPTSSSGITRSPSLVKRLSIRRHKPPSPLPPSATSRPVSAAPSVYATLHRGRRSFDSLTSAVDSASFTPLLSRNASARRNRENSGPAGRALISSTTRAKPAREGPSIPLVPAFPGGYWAPPPYVARSGDAPAAWENKQGGGAGGGRGEGEGNLSAEARGQREHLRGKQGPFWVVKRGWRKGVYTEQEEADTQTRNFPGPIMRKFDTPDEAIAFLFATQTTAIAPPLFSRQDSTDLLEPRPIANKPSDSPRTSTLGRSRSLASGDTSGRAFGKRRGAAMGYADAPEACPSLPQAMASPPRGNAMQHKPDLSPIVDRSPAAFNNGSFAVPHLPSTVSVAPRVPDKANKGPPLTPPPKPLVKSPSRGSNLREALQSSPSMRSGRASPFSAAVGGSGSSLPPPTPASMAAAALGVEAFRSEASPLEPNSGTTPTSLPSASYKAAHAVIGSTNVPRSAVFYASVLGCSLDSASASRALLTLPPSSVLKAESLTLMLRADVPSGGAVLVELGSDVDMAALRDTIEVKLRRRNEDEAKDLLSELRKTDWSTAEFSLRGPEGGMIIFSSAIQNA